MPLPADNDFDFGDFDSLQLDLDDGAILDSTQTTTGPMSTNNERNHKASNGASGSHSNMIDLGHGNYNKNSDAARDEFDDFGDFDDAELMLDDNDLLNESIPPAPAPAPTRQGFFSPAARTPRHDVQQPQQPHIPAPAPTSAPAPMKLFPIFGGTKNQNLPSINNNKTLQRAPSTATLKNTKANLARSNGSTNNLNGSDFERAGSNSHMSPYFSNSASSNGTSSIAQQTPALTSTHQGSNIIPRSDPLNDFATDIFRSQEKVGQPAQPPTHHTIDKKATLTWQYPINYPKRDYQYNIIRRALFTNTLVSLPTGLGKTFIAAVVMLNYFRWFPESKIIFMAPTRPLVNQQIEACFHICGIPQEDTAEMTGQQNSELRKEMWLSKRVIFCTPQVVQNDIKSGICPAESIVCLVIDEAHRATGRYAYSEVIRLLDPLNRDIRIMALTATPGGDIKSVQQVVQNLKIAKIEMRTEDSMDLQQYVFKRTVQEVVVPCGREVGEIRDKFKKLMRPFLERLAKMNIVRTMEPEQLSRFAILQGRDIYLRENARPSAAKNYVMRQVAVCMGLVHACELLTVHGIRPFFANMDPFATNSDDIGGGPVGATGSKGAGGRKRKSVADEIGLEKDDDNKPSLARKAMEEIPDFMRLMDSIRTKIRQPNFVSHPKIERLVGVVVQHFINHQDESDAIVQARADSAATSSSATGSEGPLPQTRVMIFANYRESVEEISRVLERQRPLVKVQSFIGQATAKGKKGISQKEQQKVVADFQSGEHNVLVATSIGEEGLDIGDVDLIICYDSHSSPIRMLQRMGRTGRKRKGKICLLLAEGQEEQKYRRAQSSYKTVQRAIAQGHHIQYYMQSPRILPPGPAPTCDLVYINVPTYITPSTARKRRKLVDGGMSSRPTTQSAFLSPEEEARFQQRYRLPKREIRTISFQRACSKLLYNRKRSAMTPDVIFQVGHSTRTIDFINTVNGIAKLRVAQSLSGLTGRSERRDSYSERMLALVDRWGPSGTGTEEMSSEAVVSRPKGKTLVTEKGRIMNFLERRRGSISQDVSNDEDGEGRNKSTAVRASRNRIDSSDDDAAHKDTEDDLARTLFGDNQKKRIRPISKRRDVASKSTKRAESSASRASAGLIGASPSASTKSTKAYFQSISDDEVDMAIMDGFIEGFGHHDSSIHVREPSLDFEERDAPTSSTRPPVSGLTRQLQVDNSDIYGGFDFQEPLVPAALWYRPDGTSDESEAEVPMDADSVRMNAAPFVRYELPPVPVPGQWYQTPKPYSRRTDNSTSRSPSATVGLQTSITKERSGYDVVESGPDEEEEQILFIESSEDEPEIDKGRAFGTTPMTSVSKGNNQHRPTSIRASAHVSSTPSRSLPLSISNLGFVSARTLATSEMSNKDRRPDTERGIGNGSTLAHGLSGDNPQGQRNNGKQGHTQDSVLWGDVADEYTRTGRGRSVESDDFEFGDLILGGDEDLLQEDDSLWE
ncbi:hypothetical protein BGZ54_008502 [Gamsiella multidivaricata]|nr:hypothetical protein BGZ54_008502 [Gamsiella multidivaricata]